MKSHSSTLVLAFIAISMIIFFLLLSYSVQVEASRPLGGSTFESIKSSIIAQAYSGPSRRGSGH
ncbi:hypothetical protein GBA52_027618 [Prunus armeniaca]|nr:hypothetical protein GBA52_027618 [Prunus armeniaca]